MAIRLTAREIGSLEDALKEKNANLVEIQARITAAIELGDLSENEEYSSALQAREDITREINLIRDKLDNYELVDEKEMSSTRVFKEGSVVAIKLIDVVGSDTIKESVEKLHEAFNVYNGKRILRLSSIDCTRTAGNLDINSPLGRTILAHNPGTYEIQHRINGSIIYRVDFAKEDEINWLENMYPSKQTVLGGIYAI